MDDLLQQGILAYRAGKRDEARKIFATVIKQDPENARAWGWMYDVSNNDKERIYCLNQMLRINPKNDKASQLLSQLHTSPLNSTIEVSSREVVTKLNNDNKAITGKEKKQSVFVPAFKAGFVLAVVFTFFKWFSIWIETPSSATLRLYGADSTVSGIMAYRIITSCFAFVPSFVFWFIASLVVMFIVRQIKKA